MSKTINSKNTISSDKKKKVKPVSSKVKSKKEEGKVLSSNHKKRPIWAIVVIVLFIVFFIWIITSSIRYHNTIGTEPPQLYCEIGSQTVQMNITGEWLSPSSLDNIKQIRKTNVEEPISVKQGDTIHCYFDKKLEQNLFPTSLVEDGVPDNGENVAINYYDANGLQREFVKATHHASRMEFDFTIPTTMDASSTYRIDFTMVFKAYDYWFTLFGSDVGFYVPCSFYQWAGLFLIMLILLLLPKTSLWGCFYVRIFFASFK